MRLTPDPHGIAPFYLPADTLVMLKGAAAALHTSPQHLVHQCAMSHWRTEQAKGTIPATYHDQLAAYYADNPQGE